ncbi:ABC transporter permease [Aegicerativicinus sediminis]|uniref:ABC transporter permease n=1 Tax=Aegicerativicinus sediminis TaxID=2893202 RepID=UPI001E56A265|nr:ABC transporter permease [Aegicerativicinus sediminis]
MIWNYIKIAWRNIKKNKLYSAINIFGLSVGLAACLLIGLYINNELSYDNFNTKADRIVRTTMEFNMSDRDQHVATTGTKVGPQFARTFPEIEEYVRSYISSSTVKNGNLAFTENKILFADPAFFKVFSFNLLEGTEATVLDAPDKIVLTETMAKKYFGEQSPINKTLNVIGKEMRVSGVCQDAPKNSQIKFDFVTQFTNLGNNTKREEWWSANWMTYFLLKEGTIINRLEEKINKYMDSPAVVEQTGADGEKFLHYRLQPLLDVHLKSDLAGFEPNGNITNIYIFTIISLLILLIASANYTNLATAQSTKRSAEIGMRKVMGANRKQVFIQFISETTTITFFAAVLGLIIATALIPLFNDITGGAFERFELIQPLPLTILIVFTLLVSFLAGIYPAMVLSSSKASGVLKKGFNSTGGNGFLRKSLIVGQFAISVFLIIYTLVILKQMDFIKTKDIGYDKDHIVVMPFSGSMHKNMEALKDAFGQIPGVLSITASYETPEFVQWGDGLTTHTDEGKKDVSLTAMPVDLNFVKTLNMTLAAGRDFIESDFAMQDTTNNRENYLQPYIINETLAHQLGWTPEEAIGQIVESKGTGPIVGVVKDFNFQSLHNPVGPLMIFLGRDFSRLFMLKVSNQNIQNTLTSLKEVYSTRMPEIPFNYHFLDDDYNALYKAEERTSQLFSAASGTAILLACLGLFGLAAFTTVQRTKEIGIRKILGANLGDIVFLVSKNFLMLVGISIAIAIPLAIWASGKWLENFSYKINVGSGVFVIAACLTLIVTLITVGYHASKAALMNPVKSLRTE